MKILGYLHDIKEKISFLLSSLSSQQASQLSSSLSFVIPILVSIATIVFSELHHLNHCLCCNYRLFCSPPVAGRHQHLLLCQSIKLPSNLCSSLGGFMPRCRRSQDERHSSEPSFVPLHPLVKSPIRVCPLRSVVTLKGSHTYLSSKAASSFSACRSTPVVFESSTILSQHCSLAIVLCHLHQASFGLSSLFIYYLLC